MSPPSSLISSPDILPLILQSQDYATLYRCTLVNKALNAIASKYLYWRVILSPPFRPFLDYLEPDQLSKHSLFTSSALPHHAIHVRELVITGHLPSRPPQQGSLLASLHTHVQAYTNLQRISLTPKTYHANLFHPLLCTLSASQPFPLLKELEVNGSAFAEAGEWERFPSNASIIEEEEGEEEEEEESTTNPGHPPRMKLEKVDYLVKVKNLENLALWDPRGRLTGLLTDWLDRLPPLRELHLLGNCGSITPGTLRSLVPHLDPDRLQAFSLGLSYSLMSSDVFEFLNTATPGLKKLHFYYYMQLRPPTVLPTLTHLTSLMVTHTGLPITTRDQANLFTKFIRWLIDSSLGLETLRLIGDTGRDLARTVGASVEGLVEHIVAKHRNLRVLDSQGFFTGEGGLVKLLDRCKALEDAGLGVSLGTIARLPDILSTHRPTKLHTLRLTTWNHKGSAYARIVTAETIRDIMLAGPLSLRRVILNGVRWEGAWTVRENGCTLFVVREIKPEILPWSR